MHYQSVFKSKKFASKLFLKENVEFTTICFKQDRILSLRPNEHNTAEFRKFKLLVHVKLVVVKSAETHFDKQYGDIQKLR